MAFQIPSIPETFKGSTEKQLVLTCAHKAASDLGALPDSDGTKAAWKRLTCGSVKRSKVEGVNSVQSLFKFIEELGDPTMTVLRPNTNNPLIKFEVPAPYKAVTPVARLKDLDLQTRGRMYASGISPCVVRRKTEAGIVWEHRLHAPNIYPIRTDAVTFILTPEWDNLVEWFAGEEPSLWEPSGNLGSQWVYLGVDLVEENIRKNKKPYGSYKPFNKAPKVFVPSAPPVPAPKATPVMA